MPRDKATRDASNAAYRERNRAAINARTRARIAAAPEKNRERVHACEAANPERVREYQSRWGKANRDKTRAWNRRQYHANPEKYRASNRRREKLVNDVSRESASHHGEPWTGPQLELAARDDLTAVQVAPMLGTRRDGSTQDIARTLPGLRSSGPDDDYGVRWERWPP